MKGRAHRYSEEELAWIEERADWPRRALHETFVMLFDRREVSCESIKRLCLRKGWRTGRTGCFPKGNTPANKSKKMPYNANSARTRFQKGCRVGRANENYKPIGTERLDKSGYLERKIHDGLPMQSRWRFVHLLRWEELNGPVPDGHCLKCLDGDKTNTHPSNWECIPRALLPRLAGRRGKIAYDDAPAELKPVLLTAAKLEHAARERKAGGSTNG